MIKIPLVSLDEHCSAAGIKWILLCSSFFGFVLWVIACCFFHKWLGEERPIISLLPSSHVLLQANARFCRSLEEEGQCMHKWLLKTSYLFAKWIEHIKKIGEIDVQTIHSPMFPESSPIATCQESILDTCHPTCCWKKPLKKPISLW